jgi:hypothetical protein
LTPLIGVAENADMSDPDDRRRWGPAAAILLLLAVPLLYPLSVGPAIFIYNALGAPERLGNFFEAIYWPLRQVPEPFDAPIEWYVGLWGR